MISKEEFLAQASAQWDSLSKLEDKCSDFYEFESDFDRLWTDLGQQAIQGLIGTDKKDRREQKTSDPI